MLVLMGFQAVGHEVGSCLSNFDSKCVEEIQWNAVLGVIIQDTLVYIQLLFENSYFNHIFLQNSTKMWCTSNMIFPNVKSSLFQCHRRINFLLICIQLCSLPNPSLCNRTTDSFKILLNDDDPFKIAQDYVGVQIGEGLQLNSSDTRIYSGILPIESAMRSCVDSGVVTNLFVFTTTDVEFKKAVWNVS